MLITGRRTLLLLLILIAFVVLGLWLAKSINNNQIPKSAKLVMAHRE